MEAIKKGLSKICWSEKKKWDPAPHVVEPYPAGGHTGPYQDMNQPLSHYWISSGHNSYLTGNQLTDDCGTSTITMSLTKGCRVIELDVYSTSKELGGPVVKHGGTLTKPVSFLECIRAIRTSAFTTSPYPVIITIELHADDASQAAMATILRQELDGVLYIPQPGEPGGAWKSPAQLKNKVLLRTNTSKCKGELKPLIYISNSSFNSLGVANKNEQVSSSSFGEAKVDKLTRRAYEASGVALREGATSSPPPPPPGPPTGAGAVSFAADELNFDAGTASDTLQEVFIYTGRHLMRVYPGGLRIDSSNYDPSHAWGLGASFVALNWQNWDMALWINEGKFAANGGCGYVLKPAWMLPHANPGLGASPRNPLPLRGPSTLQVHVYGAFAEQGKRWLRFTKDDLYLEVSVCGMPEDCASRVSKAASNSAKLNLNTTFELPVRYPEAAVLLLQLKDSDGVKALDDVVAYWSAPLSELVSGSHVLNLRDMQGGPRHDCWAKVEFKWVDPITSALAPQAHAQPAHVPPPTSPAGASAP